MKEMAREPRYAIYYAPSADHPLTVAATRWFGRDAFGEAGVPVSNIALVAEPRRYGFHATLKAPFRLKQDFAVADLEQAIETFVAFSPPCPIGPLRIDTLGSFFALVPKDQSPRFAALPLASSRRLIGSGHP